MGIKSNLGSFYLMLLCIGLSTYTLLSNIKNMWLIAPPNFIILILSVMAFILGIKGFHDKRNLLAKLRSWFTVVLSFLLSLVLLLAVLLTLLGSYFGANSHMKTISSPDGKYTIDFYRWDAGAAGTFGIRGELDGPLWFKKRIYYEKRTENVEVQWENNNIVSINNHKLDLDQGDTYGYR